MHYTVYKTTNLLTGKYYIGQHQTEDLNDGYLGSGKYLRAHIKKYGKENFKKEILFIYTTKEEMNAKEKELVTWDLVESSECYNQTIGGTCGLS